MSAADSHTRVRARACLYGFLSHALSAPEEDTLASLRSVETWVRLATAAKALEDHSLEHAVRRVRQSALGLDLETLAGNHRAAFGFTMRGAAPPYEMEYGNRDVFQMSQELADLGGFYRAFGMQLDPHTHERPDHIAAELEFMFLLCAHQAQALEEAVERQGLDHLAVTRDAQGKFLRDHLGRWGIAFGRKLAAADAHGFLGDCGELLAAFLLRECQALAIPHGPEHLELRETGTAEEMIAEQNCGAAIGVPAGGTEDDEAG